MCYTLGCSKSGGNGGGNINQEQEISFSLNANDNIISPANNFPVNVILNSTMPGKGIRISASLMQQSNNNTISQNPSINSTANSNGITIINLPEQQWCQATVTVTSIDKPSNSSSKSFTVVYK